MCHFLIVGQQLQLINTEAKLTPFKNAAMDTIGDVARLCCACWSRHCKWRLLTIMASEQAALTVSELREKYILVILEFKAALMIILVCFILNAFVGHSDWTRRIIMFLDYIFSCCESVSVLSFSVNVDDVRTFMNSSGGEGNQGGSRTLTPGWWFFLFIPKQDQKRSLHGGNVSWEVWPPGKLWKFVSVSIFFWLYVVLGSKPS